MALGALACASDVVLVGVGPNASLRHKSLGYSIAHPGASSRNWERIEVDGADLSYRGAPAGEFARASISLISQCGRPMARPELLARQLLIGTSERSVEAAGPIDVNGSAGWFQIFETRLDGVSVRVKTVTVVESDCSFDFVLTAPSLPAALEAAFDRWWRSFRNAGPDA